MSVGSKACGSGDVSFQLVLRFAVRFEATCNDHEVSSLSVRQSVARVSADDQLVQKRVRRVHYSLQQPCSCLSDFAITDMAATT